jgi:small subunit ribosomal protein S6e
MGLKIVIGLKEGKSVQKDIEDFKFLIGKTIGSVIKGESLDLPGYEFQITGGSDNAGFPMRKDVDGPARRKILTVGGIGVKKKNDGQKMRKSVAGNTVVLGTAQLNVKTIKYGEKPLYEAKDAKEAEGAK